MIYFTAILFPTRPAAGGGSRFLIHPHVFRLVAQPFLKHLAKAMALHWQLQLDFFQDIPEEQLDGALLHSH
jgi:hypothetical protein